MSNYEQIMHENAKAFADGKDTIPLPVTINGQVISFYGVPVAHRAVLPHGVYLSVDSRSDYAIVKGRPIVFYANASNAEYVELLISHIHPGWSFSGCLDEVSRLSPVASRIIGTPHAVSFVVSTADGLPSAVPEGQRVSTLFHHLGITRWPKALGSSRILSYTHWTGNQFEVLASSQREPAWDDAKPSYNVMAGIFISAYQRVIAPDQKGFTFPVPAYSTEGVFWPGLNPALIEQMVHHLDGEQTFTSRDFEIMKMYFSVAGDKYMRARINENALYSFPEEKRRLTYGS